MHSINIFTDNPGFSLPSHISTVFLSKHRPFPHMNFGQLCTVVLSVMQRRAVNSLLQMHAVQLKGAPHVAAARHMTPTH